MAADPLASHPEALLREVAALPPLPGVYRFLDGQGAVLYVGKAINLKSGYPAIDPAWRDTHRAHAGRIASLQTTVRLEAEALLLENNLIKTLAPRYNILFRDDKSYPFLKPAPGGRGAGRRSSRTRRHRPVGRPVRWRRDSRGFLITAALGREEAPLFRRTRGLGREGGDPADAEAVLVADPRGPGVQQPLAPVPALPDQAVFRPCVGLIDPASYAWARGECRALPARRCRRRAGATGGPDADPFGAAGVRAGGGVAGPGRCPVQRAASASRADNVSDRDVDVLAVKVEGGRACVNLAMVRGGRHLGDRPYFPAHVDEATGWQEDDAEAPEAASIEARARSLRGPALPVGPGAAQLGRERAGTPVAARGPPAQTGQRVSAVHQPREQRRVWLEMAQTNAALQPTRLLAEEVPEGADPGAGASPDLYYRRSGSAAHRVLRHLAHGRRGDAGVLRGVPEPRDADCAIPPLHDRG
ncbi:MAG: hypothetical protein U1F00_23320 [Rhodoferax sp.]